MGKIATNLRAAEASNNGYVILFFKRKTLVDDLDETLKIGLEFKTIISQTDDILEILLCRK